jgi:hypothetical protein
LHKRSRRHDLLTRFTPMHFKPQRPAALKSAPVLGALR